MPAMVSSILVKCTDPYDWPTGHKRRVFAADLITTTVWGQHSMSHYKDAMSMQNYLELR